MEIRDTAGNLATQLNTWLEAPTSQVTPLDGASSDLIEWARSARDILILLNQP